MHPSLLGHAAFLLDRASTVQRLPGRLSLPSVPPDFPERVLGSFGMILIAYGSINMWRAPPSAVALATAYHRRSLIQSTLHERGHIAARFSHSCCGASNRQPVIASLRFGKRSLCASMDGLACMDDFGNSGLASLPRCWFPPKVMVQFRVRYKRHEVQQGCNISDEVPRSVAAQA